MNNSYVGLTTLTLIKGIKGKAFLLLTLLVMYCAVITPAQAAKNKITKLLRCYPHTTLTPEAGSTISVPMLNRAAYSRSSDALVDRTITEIYLNDSLYQSNNSRIEFDFNYLTKTADIGKTLTFKVKYHWEITEPGYRQKVLATCLKTVKVKANTAPTVTLKNTSANNPLYKGNKVNITATAVDADGIKNVSIYEVNGRSLVQRASCNSASCLLQYRTNFVQKKYVAIATDNYGNKSKRSHVLSLPILEHNTTPRFTTFTASTVPVTGSLRGTTTSNANLTQINGESIRFKVDATEYDESNSNKLTSIQLCSDNGAGGCKYPRISYRTNRY
jgi:hypothetical protein